MGNLLDDLQAAAKQAKEDNKKLEEQRADLVETRNELMQQIQDLKKDETEH